MTEEMINERIAEIYKEIMELKNVDGTVNDIESISYYEEMNIINPTDDNIGLAEQDIFIVKQKSENNEDIYSIYNEKMVVATVDENGIMKFTDEYKESVKKIDQRFYNILEKAEDKEKFLLPGQLQTKSSKNNKTLTKDELEKNKEAKEKDDLEKDEETKEKDEDNIKEEESLEKVSEEIGVKPQEIKGCTEFDADKKITRTESFKEIVPNTQKYEKIIISRSKAGNENNSKFYFIGIDKDGKYEKIDALQPTEGVNTGKTITSINYDGSLVKEEQVSTLVIIKGRKDEGLSVDIGKYGMIEANYIRRTPENEYISIPIETSSVKPTRTEVQQFIDKTKDPKMQDNIDKANAYLPEENPKLNDIANEALEKSDIITLTDGTTTTVYKEAEKIGITIDEFKAKYEEQLEKGLTPEQSICEIEDSEKVKEEEPHMSIREERMTPEEEALERLNK